MRTRLTAEAATDHLTAFTHTWARSGHSPINVRDDGPITQQASADAQGSLNEQVMLIAGATIVLITLVAMASRLAAGRFLRPAPAVSPFDQDGRREPVPDDRRVRGAPP